MRDCPKCGKPVDGLECGHCGWGAKSDGKKPLDPLRHTCQFVTEGQRCANLGTLSQAMRGEGPWYCQTHYDRVMGWDRRRGEPPPEGFQPLKNVLRRMPT